MKRQSLSKATSVARVEKPQATHSELWILPVSHIQELAVFLVAVSAALSIPSGIFPLVINHENESESNRNSDSSDNCNLGRQVTRSVLGSECQRADDVS